MSKTNHIVVALELSSPKARTQTFLGREFLVAPAVLVRSQVLRNNLGVTYLPADEITPEWAQHWNGIPVLVGPHPTQRGVPVSGREPILWNERCAGWIFNAKAVDESADVRHLAGEVWLDKSRASAVDGLQAVLDKLASGEPVELSTGFNVAVNPTSGYFQGTAYEAVMHPDGADHLVISSEMTGACSVADGCGLGVNKYDGEPPVDATVTTEGSRTETKEPTLWEKLKARFSKQRETADNSIEEKIKIDEFFRTLNALPVSDLEMQSRIRGALQKKLGSNGMAGEVIIADMFSQEQLVIFWMITPFGSEPQGPMYYRVSYAVDAEGDDFTFSDPEKVMRVTAYEPYVGTNADAKPSSGTATNCNCTSKEEVTMSEQNKENEAIKALTDAVGKLTATVNALGTDVAAIKTAAESDPNPAIAGIKQTLNEFAQRLDKLGTVAETAVAEQERERKGLVNKLVGHFRVPFTLAELEAKPLEELRKIAQMAMGNDYSGKGGPRNAAVNADSEQRYALPVPYFEEKKEGGK